MKKVKTNKPDREVENVDDRFAKSDTSEPEKEQEELGAEETQQDSQPEETSGKDVDDSKEQGAQEEQSTKEKVDELAALKEQVDELTNKNEAIREGMQKRIDQLTYELKSQQEKQNTQGNRTWDDVTDPEEIKKYIAYYSGDNETGETDPGMVAFLTDKLTDAKIESRFGEQKKLSQAQAKRVQSWNEVVNDYPELKDQNSDHYQRTLKLVKEDERFNDIERNPEGHALAARLVGERMLREKLRGAETKQKEAEVKATKEKQKNSLDTSSGKKAEPSKRKKLDEMMEKATESNNPYGPEWRKVLREINASR